MRLAIFARGGQTSIGVVDTVEGQVLDLAEASRLASGTADPAFGSMLDLIDACS